MQTSPTNKELSVQLGQLTTLVGNLTIAINNLTTARGANASPVAHPEAAAGFALTLGLVAGDDLIDFSTKNGLVLCKAGIEPLPTSFNLNAEQVVVFKKENRLETRDTKIELTVTKMVASLTLLLSTVRLNTRPSRLPVKSLPRNHVHVVSIEHHKAMNIYINYSLTEQGKTKVLSYHND